MMEDQLKDLFKNITFQFKHRTERILTFESITPRMMGICLSHFEIEVFDNQNNELLCYESFESLTSTYELHQVVELPMIVNVQKQVLFKK